MSQLSNETRIEATLRHFRVSRAGRVLVPMEASFSLPVPFIKHDRKFLTVLVYGTSQDPAGNGLIINAPPAAITVSFPDGGLARYEDIGLLKTLGERTPESGTHIGLFPHPTLAGLKPSGYAEKRRGLFRLTEMILESGQMPEEYAQFWCLMMEPALAPYYWAIAPRFLREILGDKRHMQLD